MRHEFEQSSEQPPKGAELRTLYAEFAEENEMLAEAGISDYSDGLDKEDEEPKIVSKRPNN